MAENWRETLFVWDGILSFVEEKKDDKEENDEGGKEDEEGAPSGATKGSKGEALKLKWKGTWVGCDHKDATKVPTPKRGAFDEFVSSENAFEVEGTATKGDAEEDDDDGEKKEENESGAIIGGPSSSLYKLAMTDGSGYDLGEGDDKKRHKDGRHDVYFFSPNLRWNGNLRDQVQNMVLAVGENEFGSFVSVGWLRVGNRVTLARRYVDEGDERAKWDIDDLRKAVFDQIATVKEDGHAKLVIPPWQCATMHADAPAQGNKRQKVK